MMRSVFDIERVDAAPRGLENGVRAAPVLIGDARVDDALRRAFIEAVEGEGPPLLREAIERAVFAGGARLRPSLCLAVAAAHGDPNPAAADWAAAAIEFVHCASLVHDDLPCFDDAKLRRGQPTIHVTFGVPMAVLVGDALIVSAFGAIARAGSARLVATLSEATGPARGIVAGQAWENEPAPRLDEYHRAKTASLFMAAAALGAQVSGADARPWMNFGDWLGQAYQAADDVLDAVADSTVTGKTGGRDASLGRPSVVRSRGVVASMRHAELLVEEAAAAVPPCLDDRPVRAWLERFAAKTRL
jgi:geranylgeranyl diphosphate synthase type II